MCIRDSGDVQQYGNAEQYDAELQHTGNAKEIKGPNKVSRQQTAKSAIMQYIQKIMEQSYKARGSRARQQFRPLRVH